MTATGTSSPTRTPPNPPKPRVSPRLRSSSDSPGHADAQGEEGPGAALGHRDGRTRTLEEVGKEFNVTRERIRQIEAKALRKLRHPSRSKSCATSSTETEKRGALRAPGLCFISFFSAEDTADSGTACHGLGVCAGPPSGCAEVLSVRRCSR